MKFVSWIDTFWGISCIKILIKLQTRYFLYNWNTFVFCNSRIYC